MGDAGDEPFAGQIGVDVLQVDLALGDQIRMEPGQLERDGAAGASRAGQGALSGAGERINEEVEKSPRFVGCRNCTRVLLRSTSL